MSIHYLFADQSAEAPSEAAATDGDHQRVADALDRLRDAVADLGTTTLLAELLNADAGELAGILDGVTEQVEVALGAVRRRGAMAFGW